MNMHKPVSFTEQEIVNASEYLRELHGQIAELKKKFDQKIATLPNSKDTERHRVSLNILRMLLRLQDMEIPATAISSILMATGPDAKLETLKTGQQLITVQQCDIFSIKIFALRILTTWAKTEGEDESINELRDLLFLISTTLDQLFHAFDHVIAALVAHVAIKETIKDAANAAANESLATKVNSTKEEGENNV